MNPAFILQQLKNFKEALENLPSDNDSDNNE